VLCGDIDPKLMTEKVPHLIEFGAGPNEGVAGIVKDGLDHRGQSTVRRLDTTATARGLP
jgi:hypothetical protein